MKAHVQWLLQTIDGDKLTRLMSTDAVKKYCQNIQKKNQSNQKDKKKLDKSQTWIGDVGKNECLGGLKTQKGGPRKKLETWTKKIILIDWKTRKGNLCKS